MGTGKLLFGQAADPAKLTDIFSITMTLVIENSLFKKENCYDQSNILKRNYLLQKNGHNVE